MSQINNIYSSLFIEGLNFPLDFNKIDSVLKKIKANHVPHSVNKLIYGENVHYDYELSDNSSELDLNSNRVSYTVIDIETQTKTIGYKNDRRLFTGRGNDTILGLGNATVTANFKEIAKGESNSIDSASTDSTARAAFKATVEARGIQNNGRITTARGDDKIIGVSDVQSIASIVAESTASDLSLAKAESESAILIDVLAVGVENNNSVFLGQGKDLFVGIANTSTETEAKATAIANAFDLNLSQAVVQELNNATGNSNSIAEAINLVGTVGITNRGSIFLNQGNDIIFGLANSKISSDVSSDSQTTARANQTALAKANGESFAVIENFTIGIINDGLIATGGRNDILIGLAFNESEATSEAEAEAESSTANTDSDTNTIAIADTENITVIGIDNSRGVINTGIGRDTIIAYGSDIGIKGGKIATSNDDDKVFGYGGFVGVEDAKIYLGRGHDYFQAAIGELDPLTGAVNFAKDQTNSIRNSKVF
ncbi:MAG: hypothetical protein AAFO95_22830, partial [Cyanobacteria bacterium J06600_6]